MRRVNKAQLKDLRLLVRPLQTISTRHGVFVVLNQEQDEAYMRYLEGNLSNRQRKILTWARLNLRESDDIEK